MGGCSYPLDGPQISIILYIPQSEKSVTVMPLFTMELPFDDTE